MAKYEKTDGKVKKVKRDWKFTEKLIIAILLYWFLVCNLEIAYSFIFNIESVWWYIIPAVGALGSSSLGFFIWKEKAENLIKIHANPNYDAEQLRNQVQYEIDNQIIDMHREDNFN